MPIPDRLSRTFSKFGRSAKYEVMDLEARILFLVSAATEQDYQLTFVDIDDVLREDKEYRGENAKSELKKLVKIGKIAEHEDGSYTLGEEEKFENKCLYDAFTAY